MPIHSMTRSTAGPESRLGIYSLIVTIGFGLVGGLTSCASDCTETLTCPGEEGSGAAGTGSNTTTGSETPCSFDEGRFDGGCAFAP